ncbi:MAG TPA: hypothetical protein VEH52_05805 [Gaiellaceae bacterium]|nr:hypothetical protein [Gaiellaceae bacterium]
MRRLGVVLGLVVALLAGGSSAGADPVPTQPPTDLHTCTLPAPPLWYDYADGSVPFWKLFAKPGLIAAVPNLGLPAEIRALGGDTVYFDPHLKGRVGLPSAPADPSLIDARAQKFFIYVENSTHCSNPVIAENELYGANLASPWTPTNAQYRANVLRFLQRLNELGGQPWLLVNSAPYIAGDAGDWWRSVGQVAGIVREVYFPAPLLYKQGPILGSRTIRTAFRNGILGFTKAGIPTSKLGLFLGFQTTKGQGGREGLEPATSWFETVKLQALAAKQVAKEMHINSIWSWGWAEYKTTPGEIDPDKARAACVYLWARNPSFCDGPAVAGKGFDRSRVEGQLSLPANVRCAISGVGSVTWSAIRPLQALTGDAELAFSTAYGRALEAHAVRVSPADVLAAERLIIALHFGGSRSAYIAAIVGAKTSLAAARGAIADELRRTRLEQAIPVAAPTASSITDFLQTYADEPVRLVQTASAATWLGGHKRGYAIAASAPPSVMNLPAGRWSQAWTATGSVRVRPLGPPTTLGAVSSAQTLASIKATLVAQARDERYPAWIAAKQSSSFRDAVCWRDELPALGEADLTEYLPFLQLSS